MPDSLIMRGLLHTKPIRVCIHVSYPEQFNDEFIFANSWHKIQYRLPFDETEHLLQQANLY
jgi:hypothetical protein